LKIWLELLTESEIVKVQMTAELLREAKELAPLLTADREKGQRDKILNYSITKFPNY
jgi:hypothetical protein